MIYLSGRMRGVKNLNAPAFAKYADQLRGEGHSVFNPAAANLEGWPIEKIFAYELEILCLQAKTIALLPDWKESKGAIAEAAVADAIGKQFRFL